MSLESRNNYSVHAASTFVKPGAFTETTPLSEGKDSGLKRGILKDASLFAG
jgi:hypothetical protein